MFSTKVKWILLTRRTEIKKNVIFLIKSRTLGLCQWTWSRAIKFMKTLERTFP